ncbi:hypothetical protein PG994_010258 [Apiospora phragmitis]|uniref:Ubiquitin-like domain-containing protein n=1 Tax=Apiospora phragmitis TaxID=2905665 RepID=A0ABR1TS21_9PEZI
MLAAAAAEPDNKNNTMDHAAPAVEAAQAEPPEESIVGSTGSGEVDHVATGSSGPGDGLPPPSPPPDDSSSSKGKQSVVYSSPQQSSSAETEATTPIHTTTTGDGTSGPPPPTEEPSVSLPQPVQPGDPRWAYSSDRPPAKLPIYFHDAVGRNYTFPWEKAKTWEGMERLIRASFAHVTPVTWWVNQGRYDLKVVEPNSPEASAAGAAPMTGIASQIFTTVPAAPPPPAAGTDTSAGAGDGTGSQTQPPPVIPQQQPAAGTGAPFLQTVILPELWDDLVVPGMTVTMMMW